LSLKKLIPIAMSLMDFDLVFDGKSFRIAKRFLLDFFEIHPSLFYESSYQVRSAVPAADFLDFVVYLKSKRLPDLTITNVKSIFSLSHEFGITDLLSECSRLISDLRPVDFSPTSATAELNINILSNSTLFESFRRDFPTSFSDSFISRLSQVEGSIEKLRTEIEQRITSLESHLENDISLLKSTCDEFRHDIRELKEIPVIIGLNEESPREGIISALTRKHRGNLLEGGIVSITSKSGDESELKNLLDLQSDSSFRSADEEDQWVCFDFGETYIRLTHYTIMASNSEYPKSWVIEVSTDSHRWTEIDRRKNDNHLKKPGAVQWFEVQHSVESHFVRLTQTGKNHSDNNSLHLCCLELFGSLRVTPGRVRRPLKEDKSLDGIIRYLTQKHGGNVHDKGIVTITTKSVNGDYSMWAPRNVADLDSDEEFFSANEPGQWICWDFHEMRVRPTHYTIRSRNTDRLSHYVLETSLDGVNWTTIHEQFSFYFFMDANGLLTLPVSNSTECRFFRLTQRESNGNGFYNLCFLAFEVFGTLIE
jgi:hypothetical protein